MIDNSNATVQSCTFEQNIARKGGAIMFSTATASSSHTEILDSNFINNSATEQGAGVSYDFIPPVIQSQTNQENSAPYGPDLASYPFKLIFSQTGTSTLNIDNIGSSINLEKPIDIIVVDSNSQPMNQLNTGSVKIVTDLGLFFDQNLATNHSVQGIDSAKITNGTARFDDIAFISEPGQQGVKYYFYSSVIDYDKVFALDGVESGEYEQYITHAKVNFRYCKPGEIQEGNICRA